MVHLINQKNGIMVRISNDERNKRRRQQYAIAKEKKEKKTMADELNKTAQQTVQCLYDKALQKRTSRERTAEVAELYR
jgi:hypothetical protein